MIEAGGHDDRARAEVPARELLVRPVSVGTTEAIATRRPRRDLRRVRAQQRLEQRQQLVGGPAHLRGQPPERVQLLPLEDADDDLRVADVDRKQPIP